MNYLPDKSTPKYEIDKRLKKLQKKMKNSGIGAALIVHNADLYYFSGTIQQGHLFVPSEGDSVLMATKDFDRAAAESPLEKVIFLKSIKEIPDALKSNGYNVPEKLGMELDVLPTNHFFSYQKVFKNSQLVDISNSIRLVRAVKSLYEIEKISKASQLADEVFATVKNHLREGITELDFAGKIEGEARKRGHQGIVRMRMWGGELFFGHIMTGASAAAPSFLASPTGGSGVSPAIAQGSGFKKIMSNEPVLIDFAFVHDGYISDQTRIFCLGSVSSHLHRAHYSMLELQEKIKKAAMPGITGDEIYQLAMRFVRKHDCENNFMGAGERRIRFVGHGVGLELDEYPFLAKGQKLALEEGMVLALEPKLIYPGQGVVGIENTHLVTKNGLQQLGTFPEEIVSV